MGARRLQQAHLCEQESCNQATVAVRSLELKSIQLATVEVATNLVKSKSSTFKPTEDTKPIPVDPEDTGKTVRIGAGLTNK